VSSHQWLGSLHTGCKCKSGHSWINANHSCGCDQGGGCGGKGGGCGGASGGKGTDRLAQGTAEVVRSLAGGSAAAYASRSMRGASAVSTLAGGAGGPSTGSAWRGGVPGARCCCDPPPTITPDPTGPSTPGPGGPTTPGPGSPATPDTRAPGRRAAGPSTPGPGGPRSGGPPGGVKTGPTTGGELYRCVVPGQPCQRCFPPHTAGCISGPECNAGCLGGRLNVGRHTSLRGNGEYGVAAASSRRLGSPGVAGSVVGGGGWYEWRPGCRNPGVVRGSACDCGSVPTCCCCLTRMCINPLPVSEGYRLHGLDPHKNYPLTSIRISPFEILTDYETRVPTAPPSTRRWRRAYCELGWWEGSSGALGQYRKFSTTEWNDTVARHRSGRENPAAFRQQQAHDCRLTEGAGTRSSAFRMVDAPGATQSLGTIWSASVSTTVIFIRITSGCEECPSCCVLIAVEYPGHGESVHLRVRGPVCGEECDLGLPRVDVLSAPRSTVFSLWSELIYRGDMGDRFGPLRTIGSLPNVPFALATKLCSP
jgi:hypothetical protein